MISSNNNQSGNIKFIAVGRASDGILVASHIVQKGDYEIDKYHNACREVLLASDFQNKINPSSRYRFDGDLMAFNFLTDNQQRVFIVITASNYPERLVFPMINELIPLFNQDFGERALKCSQGALSKKAESLFTRLAREYDDPSNKDKLSQVASKVEDVRLTMHSNIDSMLQNLDKSEQIETDTQRLQDQARLFDKQAATLKRREQWRNMKITIIIGAIVLIIVILIIVYVVKST